MASVAISLALAGGGLALNYLFAPRVKQEPVEKGKLDDIRITSSDYGAFIPRLWGKGRIGGNLIWSNGVQEFVINTPSGGGKGVPQAPATRTYVYKTSVAVLVARGTVGDFLRIWADADLITNNSEVSDGNFEAEVATLSGGASIVDPDASASGGKSVTNLGNGGKAVFDLSSVAAPAEPLPGDPDEVAIAYTKVSFFYKAGSALEAEITTDVSIQQTVEFPATGSDWTTKTIHIAGHADSLDYENASADAPDLDLIAIEKYWFVDIITSFKVPGYRVSGIINEDIEYPGDIDDPSEYYNLTPTASGAGVFTLTTSVPGEIIRFYSGTATQGQDSAIVSYLDAKYGSGEGVLRCPAHRDLAYVVFENRTLKQARVENFTFEMNAGSPDVNDVLEDLSDDVGTGSADRDFTATAGLTQIGFLEHTATTSRRSLIESLERYHNFRIAEIDGKVTTVLNGTTSTATITDDLMRAHFAGGEMPGFDAEVVIKDPSQMPREVRVSFMNPAIEYHNDSVAAPLFGSNPSLESREYSFPIIDTADNARLAAEKLILKEYTENKAIEFYGMPEMAKYAVGDVITIPINGVDTVVRIEKKQKPLPIGPIRFQCVTISPFAPTFYQSDVTGFAPKTAPQFAAYNFPRNAVVIPIVSEPLNDSEVGRLGVYLAVCGRGRGAGANFGLYREIDADNYVLQSVVNVPAIAGLCAGTLATHSPSTSEDTTNTLDIWFFDDVELETVLQADLDKHPTLNLMRVGTEWVQFRTASAQTLEENSPYRSKWRISNLWRERFGTGGKAGTHAADEYAVLYTRAVQFFGLSKSDVGEDISLKAVTNGQNLEVAPVTTIPSFAPVSAYTITNDTTTRTMDADATDVDELADVVATIIDDMNL